MHIFSVNDLIQLQCLLHVSNKEMQFYGMFSL